jgi:hypothetical protein
VALKAGNHAHESGFPVFATELKHKVGQKKKEDNLTCLVSRMDTQMQSKKCKFLVLNCFPFYVYNFKMSTNSSYSKCSLHKAKPYRSIFSPSLRVLFHLWCENNYILYWNARLNPYRNTISLTQLIKIVQSPTDR